MPVREIGTYNLAHKPLRRRLRASDFVCVIFSSVERSAETAAAAAAERVHLRVDWARPKICRVAAADADSVFCEGPESGKIGLSCRKHIESSCRTRTTRLSSICLCFCLVASVASSIVFADAGEDGWYRCDSELRARHGGNNYTTIIVLL